MPELPEVETTRRGLLGLTGRPVLDLVIREGRLRWPIPAELGPRLVNQTILHLDRRAKYLLLRVPTGAAIIHLGMSGSLRIAAVADAPGPLDHVDIVLDGGQCLRFRDPRRFGCLLWSETPEQHPLLKSLGPEPLEGPPPGPHLFLSSRGRRRAIRDLLLDSEVIAGIGNIYANEALFLAGIDPRRAAGRISAARYERLGQAIRTTLERAIAAGGTTLRDFLGSDGRPGYFQQTLQVYGRQGQACRICGTAIRTARLGARSLFFCPHCQT